MIILNAYWVYHNVDLYLNYKSGMILYVMLLPNWLLGLGVFAGLLGIGLGITLMIGKIGIKKALISQLLIILIYTAVDYLTMSIGW